MERLSWSSSVDIAATFLQISVIPILGDYIMTDRATITAWGAKRKKTNVYQFSTDQKDYEMRFFTGQFFFAPDITVGRLARMLDSAGLVCRPHADGYLIENKPKTQKWTR